MTEEPKAKSKFWLYAVIVGLLVGIGYILGLWTGCAKKKPEPPADTYSERVDFGWVNIFIRAISGIKPIVYHDVVAETTILLDTVYVPKEVTKFWGIGRVNLNPNPSPSFVQYMQGGRAYEDRFMADTGLNYTYRIWQDSTGVHWQEAYLDIPSPKANRPILAVVLEAGAGYGLVDTVWKFTPEFGAGVEWTPFKGDWFALYAGVGYPPKAKVETRFKLPIIRR